MCDPSVVLGRGCWVRCGCVDPSGAWGEGVGLGVGVLTPLVLGERVLGERVCHLWDCTVRCVTYGGRVLRFSSHHADMSYMDYVFVVW